jgi:hypothetical protein
MQREKLHSLSDEQGGQGVKSRWGWVGSDESPEVLGNSSKVTEVLVAYSYPVGMREGILLESQATRAAVMRETWSLV